MSISALLLLLLCWILLHSSTHSMSIDLEDLAFDNTMVITHSSPCSTTCGLGIRTQQLCPLETDSKPNSKACHVRQVQCLDNWQCGLRIQTATAGQRLELDCLEEVMDAMGYFAFVVSWRFARGIITTNNRLFSRLDNPGLDRLILDPVKEEDAGTYCCDVLDPSYHRVKRLYNGVKVISSKVLSLDFTKGLSQWEKPEGQLENGTVVTGKLYSSSTVRNMVLISMSTSIAVAVVVFLALYAFTYWKRPKKRVDFNECLENL
ncbi:transmembrane protein 81 isoform X2 [Trichomycterus rosablanca]